MKPEFAMRCTACEKVWIRFGHTVTSCPFCGSVRTVATRREATR